MMNINNMSEDQFKTFIMEVLNNKEQVIKTILSDVGIVDTQYNGLLSVIPSLDNVTNEENTRQQLKTTMQVLARQQKIIQRLLLVNLIYVQGKDFSSDVAVMASKFGMGQEALRAMFNQKLRGDG